MMKIPVATDGSAFGEESAREVARKPWPKGSEARVICVLEPTPAPRPEMWVGSYEDYFAELARRGNLHTRERKTRTRRRA